MNKDDYWENEKRLTKRMQELDDEWREVFEKTKEYLGILGNQYDDQEFIDRETEKGGRHEWK